MQELSQSNTSVSSTYENFVYSTAVDRAVNADFFYYQNHAKNYPFFRGIDTIEIPKKLEAIVNYHVPVAVLDKIDKDRDVAKEKILFFASQIVAVNHREYLKKSPNTHKRINTKLITKILGLRHGKWVILRDFLIKGTKPNNQTEYVPIMNFKQSYLAGSFSQGYTFTDTYLKHGLTYYTLETNAIKKLADKAFFSTVSEWSQNPIISNNLKLYPKLTIPSLQEVTEEAKRLHRTPYKGKTFIHDGKKSKESFGKPKDFIYSSDGINRFIHLTTKGFPLPKVGTDRDGHRVYDLITSMPKWIRKLIIIDGERMSEIDIKCSHPNFAATRYFNEGSTITHAEIAKYLNIDVIRAKKLSLIYLNQEVDSYFNEGTFTYGSKLNEVDRYYKENHPELHDALEYEKNWGEYGHKTVCRALFNDERKLMSQVITQLNEAAIIVGYCFDAIYVKQSEALKAKAMMDSLLLESNVNTTTSITNY